MITAHGNDDNPIICHQRGQLPEEERKAEVLRLFKSGESVNHTVYLVNYSLNAGQVCDIIRNELNKHS